MLTAGVIRRARLRSRCLLREDALLEKFNGKNCDVIRQSKLRIDYVSASHHDPCFRASVASASLVYVPQMVIALE